MDQDFITDDDEENTQETGVPGPALTGEEESGPRSGDSPRPRLGVSSPRVSPPAQPLPQWYLDGMEQISDTDDDDDEVVGYLAGRSREKKSTAETNNNGGAPVVSRQQLLGIP